MVDKDPQVFLAVSEDDGLTFAFPSDADRHMTDTEAFLAACFTLWIGAQADNPAAIAIKNLIITYAKATAGEVEESSTH